MISADAVTVARQVAINTTGYFIITAFLVGPAGRPGQFLGVAIDILDVFLCSPIMFFEFHDHQRGAESNPQSLRNLHEIRF